MPRILIVDDDEAERTVIREHLSSSCSNHRNRCPGNSFRHGCWSINLTRSYSICLCLAHPVLNCVNAFSSLPFTQRTPIFVCGLDERNRGFCQNLGASGYFTKPIDFEKLKKALAYALDFKMAERRTDVRIEVKINLTLRGQKRDGTFFETNAVTKNMSKGGFCCACPAWLQKGDTVQVFFADERERSLGDAHVVRVVETGDLYPDYGFQFIGT